MSDINQVILSGEVSRPAALSSGNGGFQIAKFSLKTVRSYRGRDGAQKDRYCYIDAAVVGDAADRAARQLAKGARVVIAGQLVEEAWKDDAGRWQHALRVEARDFALLQPVEAAGPYEFTAAPPAPAPAQQMPMQYPAPPLRTMGPQQPPQPPKNEVDEILEDLPF